MVRSCFQLAAAALFALPGSAQDATGMVALGGGGGGSLDLDGLQDSLKNGGVEGLNKMLKAMSAASGMHDGSDASAHLTKDASGNAMYDFRDISGSQPKQTSVKQSATVRDIAPVAGGAPPTPRTELTVKTQVPQEAAQAPLSSSSRPEDALPMPDFGIVEPVKSHKLGGAARSLAAAKVSKVAVVPPNQEEDDDDEEAPAPTVQKSQLIVWPPETPTAVAPQAKAVHAQPAAGRTAVVTLGRAPLATPVAQEQPAASNDMTAAALANGLESMRQNLDTLVGEADSMLHTHQQLGTPTPTVAPASASVGAAGDATGAEILKRLQAIENEHARLKSEEAAQASRLEAVEEKERKEGAELKTVEQENARLRDQVKTSRSAAFLQDKSGVKTFFHKKQKLRRH